MDLKAKTMSELRVQILQECMKLPVRKQFSMRLAKPDTWIIIPYSPSGLEAPKPHLLIGDNYALLIDPTDTPFDLRTYIRECITDKPLLVANTHSHRDHTYANYLFDDCTIYMSETCQAELRARRESPMQVKPGDIALGMTHISQNDGTVVRPGDIIDLGNREIEVLGNFTPCHAPSSLMYLDKKAGILFTGDEIDPGQVNIWNQPVETFRRNILNLIERRDEFDMICAPHNGTPMHAKCLDYFVENCDRVMRGIEGDIDVGSMSYLLNPFESRSPETVEYRRWDPLTRRSEWMGTAINYNVELIFDHQLNEPHQTTSPTPNNNK